ncbi:MAG TPA: dienelactone hydrolase family protein [Candidatus Acidoferrales bacterium]|nr:dienelactone hydrolase family protein [Candidatus Acidoferrales bacterium]
MGNVMTYSRPDGGTAQGYLAEAKDPLAPGIVVIQEWWGLQEQIKGLCDRLAAAGYHALAPDLFHGVVVPYHDAGQAATQMNSLNFLEATDQDVRGAAQFFAAQGKKVGLTGFCMGGAITLLGAARIPELAAAVIFYGLPPAGMVDLADVRVPLQAHFANQDTWCTPAAVDSFETALKAAGRSCEIYRYDADHAFVNQDRPEVYDPAAADLAWQRSLAFWRRHLG